MYAPGQIVYDLNTHRPVRIGDNVWDKASYPSERTTHFVKHSGRWSKEGDLYELFSPKSIEEARNLLDKGIIGPGLNNSYTHCWKCKNWYNNCASIKKCSEWRESFKHVEASNKSALVRRRHRILEKVR